MTPNARERLVLTLPPDPAYARLARLAALHFLRAQGVAVRTARLGAIAVETRSRAALKVAARANRGLRSLALTCTSGKSQHRLALSTGRAGKGKDVVVPREPDPAP